MQPAQYEPTRFVERHTLTPKGRLVLRAVAEAMFAEDGDVSAERLDALVDGVDAYVSAASKTLRFGMKVALLVVRFAPILLFVRLRTIERLAVGERARILARLERTSVSALALAFVGWRTVMTLVFYEHPAELAAMGYSDARERHLRLPVVPAAVASGVRLKDHDSEAPPADEAHEEVA